MLSQSVSSDEVQKVVFCMAPLKAPRIDGLHSKFYQFQWDTVGKSVCELIQNIFRGQCIDPNINKTLLVLIPEAHNLENITQFHPISLCTVLYKIITKTIVHCLHSIMSTIFGPNQTSFY